MVDPQQRGSIQTLKQPQSLTSKSFQLPQNFASLSTPPPCDSALRLIYFYNDQGFKCNSIHRFLL